MACRDCNAADAEMPLDTVLTGEQWERICPEGGILCASCIVRRAAKIPDVICVDLRVICIVEFHLDPRPGGRHFQIMKALDRMDAARGLASAGGDG